MQKGNYYISSFFWSTLAKILNAVLGFVSVPLLLGLYGKAEYGILAIATSCNAYMHLLDLGMNTGAVKFFSQWKAEGKLTLIYKVARTNISFYMIIACFNIIGLVALGIWGRSLFSVTDEQFFQLRECLYIIAFFSVFSWVTTAFNQLLIADKQIGFTMQMQCIQTLLKGLLIVVVFITECKLLTYFFFLTLILSILIIPYALKCIHDNLIDSFKPGRYWEDFKIVLTFSLSIFALSLFQSTATQSRPIILSMFAANGADAVAEFRIIEVIPSFIIMICGTLSSIFLPKTSEMVSKGDIVEIEKFAYRSTVLTTIIATVFCMPFLIGGRDILIAYVGNEYTNLYIWLSLWIVLVLCQIHSTPANALILAHGKTVPLVMISAIACIISIIINSMLAPRYGVGSAIIGYSVYILINLFCYYLLFYKQLLDLSRIKIFKSFIIPSIMAFIALLISYCLLRNIEIPIHSLKMNHILLFFVKSIVWLFIYLLLLHFFKIIQIKGKIIQTFLD